MPTIQDYVLDNGLASLKSGATHIYICGTAEPTTFTAATSTNALGNNNFGAGAVIPAAIAAGSPNGRQVATAAVAAGSITATGTAAYWAITDNTNSRLLATGTLSASQAVTSGNTFTLPSFTMRLPGA